MIELFILKVHKNYCNGTYRYGPLHQISLVGTVHEEVGGYFPDFIRMLEESPFLKYVMPWGHLSAVRMASPEESNDGPILWIRPGEQLIPTAELGSKTPKGSGHKRQQSELRGLQLRRTIEPREMMFEDRYGSVWLSFGFLFFKKIVFTTEPGVTRTTSDRDSTE